MNSTHRPSRGDVRIKDYSDLGNMSTEARGGGGGVGDIFVRNTSLSKVIYRWTAGQYMIMSPSPSQCTSLNSLLQLQHSQLTNYLPSQIKQCLLLLLLPSSVDGPVSMRRLLREA